MSLAFGESIGSSFSVTSPFSETLMITSSTKSVGPLVSAVPGSLVLISRSTFTAPAMTMKKSMITKTTSIIGAIWNPNADSKWLLFFLLRRFFFFGGSLVVDRGYGAVGDAGLGGCVHRARDAVCVGIAVAADHAAERLVRPLGNLCLAYFFRLDEGLG